MSINKDLLEHIHTYVFIYFLWLLHAVRADLSSCDRDPMGQSHHYALLPSVPQTIMMQLK